MNENLTEFNVYSQEDQKIGFYFSKSDNVNGDGNVVEDSRLSDHQYSVVDNSTSIDFKLLSKLVERPRNIKVSGYDPQKIILNWERGVGNETGFIIVRCCYDCEDINETVKYQIEAGKTSFTDNNIEAGKKYVYKVKATASDGNTAYSNKVTADHFTDNTYKTESVEIIVFPTISSDFVTIENIPAGSEIHLVNIIGTLVMHKTSKSTNERIDLNRFSEGIYLLTTNSGTNRISKKIIIVK